MVNPWDSGLLVAMNESNHLPAGRQAGKLLQGQPSLSRRILVVEKDTDHRRLEMTVLVDAGYQVETAADGAAAWPALQRHRYDLLITDQFLPKVSGVALVKKLYAAGITLPVIMTTEILPTWEFALHPCLQAVTMLRKPAALNKLPDMVKSLLSTRVCTEVGATPDPQKPACLRPIAG
jgi:DNA-binding NtrC family response regulator